MFICNLKLNKSKMKKYGIILGIILIIIISIIIGYKLIGNAFIVKVNDEIEPGEFINLTSQNYTSILKSVHDDIDTYVGQKIKFTGYMYKVYDFNSNQFVLARDMLISTDFQTVIVGFLCESHETCNYENGTWIDVEGEITKGNYHGDIPIIQVTKINKTEKPENEFVYPPDENYIPTSNLSF